MGSSALCQIPSGISRCRSADALGALIAWAVHQGFGMDSRGESIPLESVVFSENMGDPVTHFYSASLYFLDSQKGGLLLQVID